MSLLVNLVKSNQDRISLGLEYVYKSLEAIDGITVKYESAFYPEDKDKYYVYGGIRRNKEIIQLEDQGEMLYHTNPPKEEGFYLARIPGKKLLVVVGETYTGVLYGLLRLSEIITQEQNFPRELAVEDAPVYKLRGPAIGIQLTKVEPPRLTYEYPITPDRFPWFYDKIIWTQFLDQMLFNRCNVIYLWTGQPFSSLIKLDDYPEALEVTEEEFVLNREIFHWLTQECDRRGIWLVLKFYSIHIPLPLATKHKVELLQSNITPLNRDYTYKSIVEFIKTFPHIGLMVCLGEALRGTQNKTDWFIDTIIPAVKEGVEIAGLLEEPPLILRGHDCDPNAIMEKAIHMYKNIYTMWKYNGESLTSYYLTGKWLDIHKNLSSHGQTHIMNVHVLANLEPFRFGATEFIQKCIQAGSAKYGTNGLHLYPLFFWDWPYSADKSEKRLMQKDRDWMWYKAWFRYAWNPYHDQENEQLYWINVLQNHFTCDKTTARYIYKSLNYIGECTPRILRRIGITEGNRQTLNLGMTMSQLTNAPRYRPNYELYQSVSTPGEQLEDYCIKEVKGEAHFGETPFDMSEDVLFYAQQAYEYIQKAREGKVSNNSAELDYYATDIEAIYYLVLFFVHKVKAASKVLTYKHTMDDELKGDLSLLEAGILDIEISLEWYKKLERLTNSTYLYANSMQTPQRKIPFPNGETYGHWSQCLPEYERELENFKKNLSNMKQGVYKTINQETDQEVKPFPKAKFKLLNDKCYTYTVSKGNQVFHDMNSQIKTYAKELEGLTGIGFSLGEAITEGMSIKIELEEDAKILLGYMNARGLEWLQVPELETNTHADDRGGLNVVIANAMQAEGCPDINLHAFTYEKGIHEIFMGTGGFTIVGIVPKDIKIQSRNAGLTGETFDKLDWLYE